MKKLLILLLFTLTIATAYGQRVISLNITGSGGSSVITDLTGTPWRLFYTDASGDVVELSLGANNTYLQSIGASGIPTWSVPAGGGDVSKVGTPVDDQVGVWTGDGTIEGTGNLTFDGSDLSIAGEDAATREDIGDTLDARIGEGEQGLALGDSSLFALGYATHKALVDSINANYRVPSDTIELVPALKTLDTLWIGTDTKIYYDSESLTNSSTTGVTDVIVQIGQELHKLVFNNTGATLVNGTPVMAIDVNSTYFVLEVDSARADDPRAVSTIGLVTEDIADQSLGLVTYFGKTRDFPTTGLIAGIPVYVAPTGGLTNSKPIWPNKIIFLGSVTEVGASGSVETNVIRFERALANQSWSFGNSAVGTFWRGGFYDFATTDANLTQASTTQAYGSTNVPYSAHATIIAGGAGTTDAGVVGLRVTGTTITDAGVRTASDADTIITDITTMTTDVRIEGKKFIGAVVFELITISGSPTTYAFDFNYGYAKYADSENTDFTVTGIEAVGVGNATDTDFSMTLFHHSADGWTYAATGFTPGGTVIVDSATDMAPEDNLLSGIPFAWKRSGLATFVNGDDSEGVIFRIIIGTNNSVDDMDIQLTGKVESF